MRGKKTGGRNKGTPNKKTQGLIEICEEEDIDLFRALLSIAKNQSHEKNFEAIKEACQYVLPKRRSLEHSGSINPKDMETAEQVAQMNKEERIAVLEAEIKAIKDDQSS